MACSLPGFFSVHGILGARILEWVAMPPSHWSLPIAVGDYWLRSVLATSLVSGLSVTTNRAALEPRLPFLILSPSVNPRMLSLGSSSHVESSGTQLRPLGLSTAFSLFVLSAKWKLSAVTSVSTPLGSNKRRAHGQLSKGLLGHLSKYIHLGLPGFPGLPHEFNLLSLRGSLSKVFIHRNSLGLFKKHRSISY